MKSLMPWPETLVVFLRDFDPVTETYARFWVVGGTCGRAIARLSTVSGYVEGRIGLVRRPK
jgi:tetrahydromethanopterin S-methyltransferase subunit D